MTEYGAYMGKVLMIDLRTHAVSEYPWTDEDRHRTVGGMRASIYNAMPKQGVEDLVAFMEKFEKENA